MKCFIINILIRFVNELYKKKRVLGVFIHLSEHRGRNIVSSDLTKRRFFQKKSEELESIITNDWNHIDDLMSKFNEFQKSLGIIRKDL